MALYVSLLGVFVVAMVALGPAVRALPCRAYERLSRRSSALLLVAPVLAAAGLTASLITPSLVSAGCHCVAHGLHHLHFCAIHPEYAHATLLPASLSLVAWSALALPRIWQLSTDVVRTWLWSRTITRAKPRTFDGVPFHLVNAPELGACTTGLLEPVIALERRLWCRLDGQLSSLTVPRCGECRANSTRRVGGLAGDATEGMSAAGTLLARDLAAACLGRGTR